MGEMANWASTPLFLYLFVSIFVPFTSASAMTGSSKFPPLIYFLAMVIVAPFVFILLFVILFFGDKDFRSYRYARLMWDVWNFLTTTVTLWILTGSLAIVHIVRFGDDAGDTDAYDDVARSYLTVNALTVFAGFWGFRETLSLVYGFTFKAYARKRLTITNYKGHVQSVV